MALVEDMIQKNIADLPELKRKLRSRKENVRGLEELEEFTKEYTTPIYKGLESLYDRLPNNHAAAQPLIQTKIGEITEQIEAINISEENEQEKKDNQAHKKFWKGLANGKQFKEMTENAIKEERSDIETYTAQIKRGEEYLLAGKERPIPQP